MYVNHLLTPPYSKPTVLPDDTLYVVTSIFNSSRYNSRIRLYKEFENYIASIPGAKLVTVEVAYGDRPYEVTEPNDPFDIQLRTRDAIFHKERAINIAVSRLPHDWKYMAWVDADVYFSRPDWAIEAVQELQHWPVVQLFRECVDLGPEESIQKKHYSFGYCLRHGISGRKGPYYDGTYAHPGFGFAYTRDAWNTMGGMLDFSITGGGDTLMAHGFTGTAEKIIPKGMTKDYTDRILDWQNDAKELKGMVGYVRATLLHKFHGTKSNRGYKNRHQILADNNFEPSVDLRPNEYLLWQIDKDKPGLKIELEAYFRARCEDGLNL